MSSLFSLTPHKLMRRGKYLLLFLLDVQPFNLNQFEIIHEASLVRRSAVCPMKQ